MGCVPLVAHLCPRVARTLSSYQALKDNWKESLALFFWLLDQPAGPSEMIVPAPRQKVQAVTDRYKHLQAADTTNPFTTWESDVPLFLRGEASFLPRGILRCQHLKFSLSLSRCVSLSNNSNSGSDTNCLTTALEKSFYLLSQNSASCKQHLCR